MSLESVLAKVTWGDIYQRIPHPEVIGYAERVLKYGRDTPVTLSQLKSFRKRDSEWLDRAISSFISEPESLTKNDLYTLALGLETEELRYAAASDVPRLTSEQRWNLVRGIKDEEFRYEAACNVSGLSSKQRWNLVEGIKDKSVRYKASRDVPQLTEKQREELSS